MSFGVSWIDIFRAAKPLLRVAVVVTVEGDHAKVVERAFVLRINIDDGAIKELCFGRNILGETQVAESEERFRVVRNICIGNSEFFFGERQVVRFQRLPAGIVSVKRPKRRIALWPGDENGGWKEQREIDRRSLQGARR